MAGKRSLHARSGETKVKMADKRRQYYAKQAANLVPLVTLASPVQLKIGGARCL